MQVEHTNLRWKVEVAHLCGQMTAKTVTRLSKSMNLGDEVDRKVELIRADEEEEVEVGARGERVRVNRKNPCSDQIQKGVEAIEVPFCSNVQLELCSLKCAV